MQPFSMMGRAGIEPTTLGLRVRPNELQRPARNGIFLQSRFPRCPANGNELQPTEPIPYAHSYAQAPDLRDRQGTLKPAVAGTRPARPRLGPRSVTRNSVTRSSGRRSGRRSARRGSDDAASSWESARTPAPTRAGARRDERFARASRVAHSPHATPAATSSSTECSRDSSATDRDVEIAPVAETAGLGNERRVPIHTPRLELTAPAPTNTVCYRTGPQAGQTARPWTT
jgi:hypothetical protein